MKNEYLIKGMSCGHCRRAVEESLNSIEGVKATVTLDPPRAVVEFSGERIPIEQLQDTLSLEGDYRIELA